MSLLGLAYLNNASSLAVHTNLVITKTNYRIKKTLHLRPCFKDSISNLGQYEAKLEVLEKLLLRQTEGKSEDLTDVDVVDDIRLAHYFFRQMKKLIRPVMKVVVCKIVNEIFGYDFGADIFDIFEFKNLAAGNGYILIHRREKEKILYLDEPRL